MLNLHAKYKYAVDIIIRRLIQQLEMQFSTRFEEMTKQLAAQTSKLREQQTKIQSLENLVDTLSQDNIQYRQICLQDHKIQHSDSFKQKYLDQLEENDRLEIRLQQLQNQQQYNQQQYNKQQSEVGSSDLPTIFQNGSIRMKTSLKNTNVTNPTDTRGYLLTDCLSQVNNNTELNQLKLKIQKLEQDKIKLYYEKQKHQTSPTPVLDLDQYTRKTKSVRLKNLNDIQLFSARKHNCSVDQYYEPPSYKFNVRSVNTSFQKKFPIMSP